ALVCKIVLQYLCLSFLLSCGPCPYVYPCSVSRARWPTIPACQLHQLINQGHYKEHGHPLGISKGSRSRCYPKCPRRGE
ncbi:hypothetical protein FB451DRAFT_1207404, partial [Mycena latifolia]